MVGLTEGVTLGHPACYYLTYGFGVLYSPSKILWTYKKTGQKEVGLSLFRLSSTVMRQLD